MRRIVPSGLGRFLLQRMTLVVAPAAALVLLSVVLARVDQESSKDPRQEPIDLVARLRARRGWVQNATGRTFGSDPRSLPLHPNGSRDRPAQVVFPIDLRPGSCFAATLALASQRGDGVIFEVELASRSKSQTILREKIVPDQPVVEVWEPIPALWSGRPVELRLRTRPGPTDNYDWARFDAPRIVPCDSSPRSR